MPQGYVTKNFVRLDEAYRKGYTTASLQGSSRCFGAGTLIRMANGTLKAVEKIRVGDRLMDSSGRGYNTVTEVHSGIDEMYLVHQKRGIDFTVNSGHLLSMKQTRAKQHKVAIPGYKSAEKRRLEMLPYDRSVIHNFSTKWFSEQSKNFQKRYSCFKNTDIELPERELPIDPYYLGAWLGDGCSYRCNEITNVDPEIIEWFYSFSKTLNAEAHRVDKVTYRFAVSKYSNGRGWITPEIENFVVQFRKLGVLKNKHIPELYIYNSKENRLKLLAGLIDTDGCVTSRNTYCITQKNKKIIEAIEEICHITGFFTNGKRRERATMKRSDGSLYETEVYSIEINHSDFKELQKYIKIPRKRFEKQCNRDYFCTSISIEPIGLGEYYGFSLDNSPYFLLEDGTIQHNSSKTYSNVQWLIRMCYDVPGTTVSIVRKTMPALKRSVFRDFREIMIEWGLYNDRQMNKSEFVYTFGNGSWIEFFSCEDEQKLRGSKRKILFVNEANEISFLEWQQLQMRTTAFSIIDYNPSFSEEHWINQVNDEKRTCFWISTYKDNPFLEQKVIDEIESLQWKNNSLWQVYGLGQRAVVEGLVFPNIEIIDHIPREATRHRFVGMDLGYSNDATAIVEVCFWKDAMYLNQLCYRTHMLTADIIRELKAIEWEPEIISESADPRMVDEIYNAGLDIKAVHKYQGSINAGIMKMKEYRMCVTRQSSDLIKEFRNYTYRQDKEGKWLNEPIDAFNHCFVGETLVSTIKGNLRIDSIKVGDIVKTSRGNHKVSKIFNNGTQKVLRVRFFFNNFVLEIEATPNHLFKTKEGWKKLEELKPNDVLYLNVSSLTGGDTSEPSKVCTEEAQNQTQASQGTCGLTITKSLRKTRFAGLLTEIRRTLQKRMSPVALWTKEERYSTKTMKSANSNSLTADGTLNTRENATIQEEQNAYIEKYGSTITEKYQKAITSTTKTETPKTTLSRILNWCKRMNTSTITPKSTYNQKSIWRKLENRWRTLLNMLKSGINQKKVENGTDSTERKSQKISNLSNLCASNVENISLQSHRDSIDSAPITVNPSGAETTTSMMKCESVSYAGKSLLSTNTAGYNSAVEAVVCDIVVLNESYKEVYDIEVEKAHEFFANGILVHNCIDAIRYVVLEKILGGYGSGMSASEILGIVG